MILPLTLILCFMVSCQDKEAMAELEAMKAQAEVEEKNKELIKSFFEVADSGDVEKKRDYYSSETICYSPSGSSDPMTGDEDIELTKMFMEAFPDLSHISKKFLQWITKSLLIPVIIFLEETWRFWNKGERLKQRQCLRGEKYIDYS